MFKQVNTFNFQNYDFVSYFKPDTFDPIAYFREYAFPIENKHLFTNLIQTGNDNPFRVQITRMSTRTKANRAHKILTHAHKIIISEYNL